MTSHGEEEGVPQINNKKKQWVQEVSIKSDITT